MKIFNSIGHFFAWVLHTGLPKAETVAQDVAAVASSPLTGAIAQLLGAKGVAVQMGIEAIAGDVLHAFAASNATIGAGGLNVNFDAVTVQSIESLYHDLGSMFGKTTATAPKAGTVSETAA